MLQIKNFLKDFLTKQVLLLSRAKGITILKYTITLQIIAWTIRTPPYYTVQYNTVHTIPLKCHSHGSMG